MANLPTIAIRIRAAVGTAQSFSPEARLALFGAKAASAPRADHPMFGIPLTDSPPFDNRRIAVAIRRTTK